MTVAIFGEYINNIFIITMKKWNLK
jgi:hypothetical protein